MNHSHSPGALIVSLLYNGHQQLDLYRRSLVFGALVACCVLGTVSALGMRHLRPEELEEDGAASARKVEGDPQSYSAAINQSRRPTAQDEPQTDPAIDTDAGMSSSRTD